MFGVGSIFSPKKQPNRPLRRTSVARFGRYRTGVVAALFDELKATAAHLRRDQLDVLESILLGLDDTERYDGQAIRRRVVDTQADASQQQTPTLRGNDLIADLVRLIKDLSLHPLVNASSLPEPVVTGLQIAGRLDVSEKTVRRWALAGLVGRKFRFDDGKARLAYLESSVRRFIDAHPDLINRAARFSLLADHERELIVGRARQILQQQPMKRHPLSQQLSKEMGRSIEAIRTTLLRFDEDNPTNRLFEPTGRGGLPKLDQSVLQRRQAGESDCQVARAVGCTIAQVRRIMQQEWIRVLIDSLPRYVSNGEFEAPDAKALILGRPAAHDGPAHPGLAPPPGIPSYLRALYRQPLLGPNQERDLFRRYNFLKYQATQLCRQLDPHSATRQQLEAVETVLTRAGGIRDRLICANLRLVVGIVKKQTGRCQDFFEVVSEGNVALMRSVESFDYARGNRFSTYATWAIRRSLARELPAMRYGTRPLPSCDQEVLENVPDVEIDLNEQLAVRELRERVRLAVHRLEGRAREIVLRHFGLVDGQAPETLSRIGKDLGISKERVRQIEQKAIIQLQLLLEGPVALEDRTAA